MRRQYYQSQYILNQCFVNRRNILRATLNNAQDYLNAVYDNSQDALRVNIAGGMLPMVDGVDSLPDSAAIGQICPVYNSEKDCIDFYEWDGTEWVYRGGTLAGDPMDGDERAALEWVTEHIDQIKEVANFNYIVNVEDIVLPPGGGVVIVQGQPQNIDDDLNNDADHTTPYRIDFSGYVLSISTYADADAVVPDRYYTRITYESANGGLGSSHIYLQQEEYDYFAALPDGKNIVRVYYLTNAMTSPIKRIRYILNADCTVEDENGDVLPVTDDEDTDGDPGSMVSISVGGYVLGVETYATSESLVPDKYYTKMVYESDGVHSGRSHIYMDSEEYEYFANLENGRNIMDIYYVSTVFPASVTISETQLMFPSEEENFVVIDASGNVRNVTDDPDKDGDEATHIRITVNGYAIDMDGYYNENDPIKKRLIVKMSYNSGIDTTDIYVDREYYEYAGSMGNGRNIVSIYTVGAGIGVDASRITATDSALDSTSERAIQNKAVSQAVQALQEEIAALRARVEELGG